MQIFKTILFVFSVALFLTSCDNDDDATIDDDKLPEAASVYLQTHFKDIKITRVTKDRGDNDYDVYLENDVTLEFTDKGEVESIKSIDELPNSVIPAKILDYVTTNYPDEYITEWELDGNGQEVQLSNKLELKFNKAGDFIRIDN